MSNAYQITDKEIMIFGGKSALTFQIFDGVFVLDLERMQIKERGTLVNPCSFMNTPLVFNHTLYAYGNDVYIHKYHIPEQRWSCIHKQVWDDQKWNIGAFKDPNKFIWEPVLSLTHTIWDSSVR